jgi:hypothetical protein
MAIVYICMVMDIYDPITGLFTLTQDCFEWDTDLGPIPSGATAFPTKQECYDNSICVPRNTNPAPNPAPNACNLYIDNISLINRNNNILTIQLETPSIYYNTHIEYSYDNGITFNTIYLNDNKIEKSNIFDIILDSNDQCSIIFKLVQSCGSGSGSGSGSGQECCDCDWEASVSVRTGNTDDCFQELLPFGARIPWEPIGGFETPTSQQIGSFSWTDAAMVSRDIVTTRISSSNASNKIIISGNLWYDCKLSIARFKYAIGMFSDDISAGTINGDISYSFSLDTNGCPISNGNKIITEEFIQSFDNGTPLPYYATSISELENLDFDLSDFLEPFTNLLCQ